MRLATLSLSARLAALALVALAACGDDKGTTTDTTAATPGTTDPPGTTTGTSTTEGEPGTTTAPTTSTTTAPTTAGETTADPTTTPVTDTGDTTDTGLTTDTGETTAGETTAGETTAGETTDTTGAPPEDECVDNKDCKLHSDCCVCEGVPVDEEVMDCGVQCLISTCDSLKIDAAFCRLGQCVTARLNCDDSKVICLSLPPECMPGQVPEVTFDGKCWTGACVPASVCNFVPSCDLCVAGEMCVTDDTQLGTFHRCEPIPAACAGKPTCECAGQACDNDPHNACQEAPDGLNCSCPQC